MQWEKVGLRERRRSQKGRQQPRHRQRPSRRQSRRSPYWLRGLSSTPPQAVASVRASDSPSGNLVHCHFRKHSLSVSKMMIQHSTMIGRVDWELVVLGRPPKRTVGRRERGLSAAGLAASRVFLLHLHLDDHSTCDADGAAGGGCERIGECFPAVLLWVRRKGPQGGGEEWGRLVQSSDGGLCPGVSLNGWVAHARAAATPPRPPPSPPAPDAQGAGGAPTSTSPL